MTMPFIFDLWSTLLCPEFGIFKVLCKAIRLLELFSLIVNMSRGNLLHDCVGTAIHNCLSSGSLFFATLRWNN